MNRVDPTEISGVVVGEYSRYGDVRGSGSQLFDSDALQSVLGRPFEVGAASILVNNRGALRGFHVEPSEGREKFVACLTGEVWDVVVDLRPGSATYGEWAATPLSESNRATIVVPRGVGHALLGISSTSTVSIFTDATSTSTAEIGVDPFDDEIGVQWPDVGHFIRSPRDVSFSSLAEFAS